MILKIGYVRKIVIIWLVKKHRVDCTANFGGGKNRIPRYRIPPNLIEELFMCINIE